MSEKLKYVVGDATSPISDSDIRLIIHCCNDIGGWGRGFVLALSKRDSTPEKLFRSWANGSIGACEYELGNIQICPFVEEGLCVANMVGQHGISTVNGTPPIRYDSIAACLLKVKEWVKVKEAEGKSVTVHAPRFGAGLAGGRWDWIESLIVDNLCDSDIDVTIYDMK